MHAAVESAQLLGREGHADRKMLLEMAGAYRQGVDVTSDGEKLGAPLIYLPDNGRDNSDD
jgi:hypothetical protein